MGNVGGTGCGGREKIAEKKGGGKGAGDKGAEGCGRGAKVAEKKKGEGAGDWGVVGAGEGKNRQKMGKRAGWEMLAGEDNPEKDGKY